MTGHPTLPLLDPFTGRIVQIDVEMAPIIATLWRLGIETLECCQGDPGRFFKGSPAVICFPVVGRLDCWGLLRSRYRRGKQHATRLVMLLHEDDPIGWWRTWDWVWDDLNPGSALLLPNEELPLLVHALERIERAAAGQLALEFDVWKAPACPNPAPVPSAAVVFRHAFRHGESRDESRDETGQGADS